MNVGIPKMACYSPIARNIFRRNIFNASKTDFEANVAASPERKDRPAVVYPGDDIDLGPEKVYSRVDMYGLGLKYDKNIIRYEMDCSDPKCKCQGLRHIAGKFRKNLDKSDWWAPAKVGIVHFNPRAGAKLHKVKNNTQSTVKRKTFRYNSVSFDFSDIDAELAFLRKLLEKVRAEVKAEVTVDLNQPDVARHCTTVSNFTYVPFTRGLVGPLFTASTGFSVSKVEKQPVASPYSRIGNFPTVLEPHGLVDPLLGSIVCVNNQKPFGNQRHTAFSESEVRNFRSTQDAGLRIKDPSDRTYPLPPKSEDKTVGRAIPHSNIRPFKITLLPQKQIDPSRATFPDLIDSKSSGKEPKTAVSCTTLGLHADENAAEPINLRHLRRLLAEDLERVNSGLVQLATFHEKPKTVSLRNQITMVTPSVPKEMSDVPARDFSHDQLSNMNPLQQFITGTHPMVGSNKSSSVFLRTGFAGSVPGSLFMPRRDLRSVDPGLNLLPVTTRCSDLDKSYGFNSNKEAVIHSINDDSRAKPSDTFSDKVFVFLRRFVKF